MKPLYTRLAKDSKWTDENAIRISSIPEVYRHWLSDRGSLTSALIELSNDNFRVNVLRQRIAIPTWHEQRNLGQPLHIAAMIREVELLLYDTPVVFARSIIPLRLVKMGKSSLGGLGNAPLGYFLFKAGNIRLSKRQLAATEISNQSHYARRTPYDYKGSTVLVSEFFLPAFDGFIK